LREVRNWESHIGRPGAGRDMYYHSNIEKASCYTPLFFVLRPRSTSLLMSWFGGSNPLPAPFTGDIYSVPNSDTFYNKTSVILIIWKIGKK